MTSRDLNRSQRRAVDWNDGPLLVLGGPGSGKTAVLTLRLARLLEKDDDAAALGLARTVKVAAEMRKRVDRVFGEHTDRARLCTFHEFAADLLGQHGSHLGIRPDFQLITQDEDSVAILEEVIAELPGVGRRLPADRNDVLHLVDRLFAESYNGEGESPPLTSTPAWLPPLFRRYCDALAGDHRLDYGSLLFFANRLLREKPAVARVVRLGWTHICVDGFQDTNRSQYDLLRLIAPGRRHNLCVVGDDDPISYRWNGASPQRFRDLRGDYELETIRLPESHRCPPEILDHANRLFAHDLGPIEAKETVSVRESRLPYDGIVRHRVFGSLAAEAEFVADDIRERGLPPGDCWWIGCWGRGGSRGVGRIWPNRPPRKSGSGRRCTGRSSGNAGTGSRCMSTCRTSICRRRLALRGRMRFGA
ncbi:MAG: ATP-dependent helicase [Gemmatimonadota bacterium]|nr:ATP-dependent helicase [Gemmatimonadota bacterium]